MQKKLLLKDILTFPVTTVAPDQRVDIALSLMREQRISSLVVVEQDRPVGIFTERDAVLLAYRQRAIDNLCVSEVMSSPALSAPPDMDYREGYRLIAENQVRHLIVVDETGCLAGLVSEGDFLEHIGGEFLVRFKEVGSLMTRELVTLPEDAPVDEAVEAMALDHISCVLVEKDGIPLGMFTERDLVRLESEGKGLNGQALATIMSKPVKTVPFDMPLLEALQLMDELSIRRLVVVDKQEAIAGLVTRHDVVKLIYDRQVEQLSEILSLRERELEKVRADLTTEHELLRSEERLEESQRLAKIGSWELDLLNDNLWWSREVYAIFEIEPEGGGANYEAFLNAVHPDDREYVNNAYKVSLADHTPYDIVHRLKFDDNRIKYVNECCKTFYDESGKPLRSIGTVQDITERRQAEIRLAENERRMQSILSAIPYGIQENDCEGRITFSNPAHNRIHGYEDDELNGKYIWDMLASDDDRDELKRYFKHLLETQPEPTPYISVDSKKDAIPIWVQTDWDYRRDNEGRVTGFISVISDITEKKQAEMALRDSERRLNTLMSNLPGMAYRCRNDNLCTMEFLSDGCESLTGYSPQSILQNQSIAYAELIHEDDREAVIDQVQAAVAAGKPYELVYRMQHHSGEIRWVWEQGRCISNAGETPGHLEGYIADITDRKRVEDKLRQSEARYRGVVEDVPVMLCRFKPDGEIIFVNRAYCECFGRSAEELVGSSFLSMIPESDREVVMSNIKALNPEQPSHSHEHRVLNPDGSVGWQRWINRAIFNVHGEIDSYQSIGEDISEKKLVEERLRLSASVFENTTEGVMVTDVQGNILEVNPSFSEIMGYSREEVLGQNPRIFKSQRHGRDFYRNMWKSIEKTGRWRGEIWNRRKDGAVFPEWQNISSVFDEQGKLTHYVSVFSDISQIKQSQEKLNYLAHHDALTDLPNRLLLIERLEQAILHASRRNRQLAVIFLDLDHFKHINDSLGHPAGDLLLKKVALFLQQTVRQEDTVARLGGDEFVLLIEDVGGAENLGIVAQKLLMAFKEPVSLLEQEISVSASLGICLYPQDGESAAELLRNADAAMYRAKEEGRNTYQFYTAELTRNAFQRVLMENNLRQALEKQELILHYQPQLDLLSGRIIGVEALIRWQHPQLGLIFPENFIPVAEDSGLIVSIGQWGLQEACRRAKAWLDKGIDVGRVAVNVAGPQIQRGCLVEHVKEALSQSQLPAWRLEIEVTESYIMQHTDTVISQLDELREIGISMAIDDFGTGYSSLSHLKQLPVSKIKIDQSFIRGIPDDRHDTAITGAVIALADGLGLDVVAEGVETEDQAAYLKEEGCHEAQGYLYGTPMSAEDFEYLMLEDKCNEISS